MGHSILESATLALMTATLTVGELATQAGITSRTLRYYERIGLLVPSARTAAGYRLYSEQAARRLAFIRQAQALGLALTDIAEIITLREAGTVPCRQVRAVALAKVSVIDARIAALQALRDDLTALAARAEATEVEGAPDASICLAIEGGAAQSS